MESSLVVDQDTLIRAVQNAVKTKSMKLQDGREVLVCQGRVIETAKPRVRPALSRIDVETLDSLVELVSFNQADVGPILRIHTPTQVMLVDISEPEFHQIMAMATAQIRTATMLESYVSLEQALIEIRECFEQTPMVEQLSDTLRTTRIEDITELTDNGMGMNLSVKSRVANGKNGDATAFDLVLTPIRTFVEVESVPGVFTMRWKREGDSIKVRLIEQSAHKWRYTQMQEIKAFLENLLPEATILM